MPAFVPRWYRKTIDAVSDYPGILRATATAIQMGVDVARPMFDAWHHFKHGFFSLVLESIEDATTQLLTVPGNGKWREPGEETRPLRMPPQDPPISTLQKPT